MSDVATTAIFVYGTLKRGQVRESMWPHIPTSIETATSRGRLCDLGPYPAMLPGDDVVAGEIWRFTNSQMAETLRVLDEIEDYHASPDDLYKRLVVECRLADGTSTPAFTYFYATELPESQRVPVVDGRCTWP